ncbi:MAG: DNA-binding protein [Candidatus Diapherotrites archaeon]|nr:DNA-binding protein [Candidatus Diapherotrites archaeon]
MDENNSEEEQLAGLRKQLLERQKALEAEAQLNRVVKTLLDDAARERLNNVKLVNSELYMKAVQAMVYLYNNGKIRKKISETQLLQLLQTLRNKREITIRRK